jgi:hypothetical protein
MKQDKELQKIAGLVRRLDELYDFLYSGRLQPIERRRVLDYIFARYKWLFDFIADKTI